VVIKICTITLLLLSADFSFCQGLDRIPQVLSDRPTSNEVSFILTPGSKIEIIDANEPWPPRWFAVGTEHKQEDAISFLFLDARFQNDYVTICKIPAAGKSEKEAKGTGYFTCNNRMRPVDVFNGVDLPVNYHDFRINDKGEKLYTARLDTLLDLRGISGNQADTAVKPESR